MIFGIERIGGNGMGKNGEKMGKVSVTNIAPLHISESHFFTGRVGLFTYRSVYSAPRRPVELEYPPM